MILAVALLMVAGANSFTLPVGSYCGPAGCVSVDPENYPSIQFSHDQVGNFISSGPSGVVFKDGKNIQFVPVVRNKRSAATGGWLIGAGGAIGPNGELVQFKSGDTTLLVDGPSGAIFSDGTLVQKRPKRSAATGGWNIGAGGAIGPNGELVQFKSGDTTLLLDGPSGAIFSDGTLVQKKPNYRSLLP